MSYLFISTYTWYVFDISSIFFTCLFCRTFVVEIKNRFNTKQLSTYLLIERKSPQFPACFPDLLNFEALLLYYQLFRGTKTPTQQNIHWAHVIDDRYVEIWWNQISFVMIFRIGWADDNADNVMGTCRRRKHCLLITH